MSSRFIYFSSSLILILMLSLPKKSVKTNLQLQINHAKVNVPVIGFISLFLTTSCTSSKKVMC